MMKMKKMKIDVYQEITDKIISKLESGEVPWVKAMNRATFGYPQNFLTKKIYKSSNFFMTLLEDRETPYWLTYKQAQELGGSIKKGEHGIRIVYYKFIEKEVNGEKTSYPMIRYSVVFNLEQCEGIENPFQDKIDAMKTTKFDSIDACEQLVSSIKDKVAPVVKEEGYKAFYMPTNDTITMADRMRYVSEPFYYRTLFHEIAHSTGHIDRLNRPGITKGYEFGSQGYAREELVAELTSAFLCGKTGILDETFDKTTSYIDNWLNALKRDKMLVHDAMKESFKAIEYLGILDEAA